MTSLEAFKFGFLSRCIESGITQPDEIVGRLKAASIASGAGTILGLALGESGGKLVEGAGAILKGIAGYGIPIAAAVPPLAGYGIGSLAARATADPDMDADTLKTQETIDEYHRQADKLRREGALRRFVSPVSGYRPRAASLI